MGLISAVHPTENLDFCIWLPHCACFLQKESDISVLNHPMKGTGRKFWQNGRLHKLHALSFKVNFQKWRELWRGKPRAHRSETWRTTYPGSAAPTGKPRACGWANSTWILRGNKLGYRVQFSVLSDIKEQDVGVNQERLPSSRDMSHLSLWEKRSPAERAQEFNPKSRWGTLDQWRRWGPGNRVNVNIIFGLLNHFYSPKLYYVMGYTCWRGTQIYENSTQQLCWW